MIFFDVKYHLTMKTLQISVQGRKKQSQRNCPPKRLSQSSYQRHQKATAKSTVFVEIFLQSTCGECFLPEY